MRSQSEALSHTAWPGMRSLYPALALLSLIPLAVVLPLAPTKVGIAIMAAWTVLLWVAISFVRGRFHSALPLWVAAYPYCYYLFSYPVERSIFTVDRAFIILLALDMLLAARHPRGTSLTRDLRVSGYLWALYILICFFSVAAQAPSQLLPSYRVLVDGLVLPAVLCWYAIRYFPLPSSLSRLHTGACILGIGLFLTGLAELLFGIDLFPWNGAEPLFTPNHVRRADGPFEQQEVLALVAILAFFFIVYLRRLLPREVSPWRWLLHAAGAVASFGAALVPLNRGLVLVLAPVAIIDAAQKNRLVPRRIWLAVFTIIVFAALAMKFGNPRLYDDRVSSPDNFYQRLAQHRETLQVVREHPLFGVGLNLYHDFASRNPRYMAKWKGIESMNFPHNVLMTVLSEEGIVGLVLYIAAQLFLIRAMWKIRDVYQPGWLAFLYCVLVYALIGLDYGTVYFSDINLFYMLILGIFLQVQLRVAREPQVEPFAA